MSRATYHAVRIRRELRKALSDLTPPLIARSLARKPAAAGDRREIAREKYDLRLPVDAELVSRIDYAVGQPVLAVPAERLRYAGGIAFTDDDHPMRRFYRGGPEAMAEYYDRHQPRDVFEKAFLPSPRPGLPSEGLPWVLATPMDGVGKGAGEVGLDPAVHGVQHFGPVSPTKLALEAERLTRVRASLAARGFDPGLGFPNAYFLLGEGDAWAAVVQGGQHRVGAMVDLGHAEIALVPSSARMTVVRRSDALRWPMVRDGALTRAEAEAIFDAFVAPGRALHFSAPRAGTAPPRHTS